MIGSFVAKAYLSSPLPKQVRRLLTDSPPKRQLVAAREPGPEGRIAPAPVDPTRQALGPEAKMLPAARPKQPLGATDGSSRRVAEARPLGPSEASCSVPLSRRPIVSAVPQ